jgi:hypothetical protein
MGEVAGSGLSQDQVLALIAANAPQPSTSFVGGGTPMLVADLLTNFPAGSATLFKYARVTDLWGSAQSVMICERDASGYYWRPQRTDYAPAPVAMTGGGMTLTPLVTAPVINLTGTLASAITLTPSAANVWPGATFTVTSNSILGIFGITIAGLVGGGTIPLLSGGIRTLTYFSGTGWKAA